MNTIQENHLAHFISIQQTLMQSDIAKLKYVKRIMAYSAGIKKPRNKKEFYIKRLVNNVNFIDYSNRLIQLIKARKEYIQKNGVVS